MAKKTVLDFLDMKRKGEKITFLTAYDYPIASFAEKAGIDMLLVGDSLGMVVYGLPGTVPVTMDEMIIHSRAVRRGAPNTFVIGDMPFMSYQSSVEKAVENAGRFLKEAQMDAIKLEGGRRVINQIKAIVDAGIPVMGHIGLTPQSSGQLGGFKAQGRTAEAARELILDAIAIQEAGAFAILLEAIPPEVGEAITKRLTIPVLSIGAGIHCDGQLLINGDMLGLVEAFTPKFVKKYANLAEIITAAIAEYIRDVRELKFPEEKHTYKMKEGEAEKLAEFLKSLDSR
ncbi:MAG: 3-methyl-2-oxobutanoate hydroxymethyltransferase [Bacillota bacterium]|nr:3-methyl-2-oxobutanoate hydroxymethyltransferase [Bacillota bacterium]MDI6637673.1 3-methyl-2-oxobutanoate hydroxymethyltransferase [Bacillota bacterium]